MENSALANQGSWTSPQHLEARGWLLRHLRGTELVAVME